MISTMIIPLRTSQGVVGALNLTSGDRSFDGEDLKLAEEFCRRMGWAVENTQLFENLQTALKRAEDAVRARDSLISISAHELLTPVTSSKLQMRILQKKVAHGANLDAESIRKVAAQTERQLDRLTKLVNDMLDTSRINLGKLTISREWVNLSILLVDYFERSLTAINSAACEIKTEIEPDILVVVDPYRIEQVVTNLISNACRYAPGKKVTISLKRDGGRHLVLTVSDQGMGIREEDQKRVFERFERATTLDEKAGLGLGLYIVKQIVESHGGTVTLESKYGEGATFRVRLPLAGEN